ncbi:hypothetical protein WA538_000322 [Blastocystis sp. DL]
MEVSNHKENSQQNDSSLFGLPTSSNGNLARSREALLLRLEKMKIDEKAGESADDSSSSDSDAPLSPSHAAMQKRSKPIPIVKNNRRALFSNNEGRGFTDDMMFFAAGCEDEDSGSGVSYHNEPFVPPHLQHNDSFTVRSFA